jgi:hypothetical protein
MVSSFLWLWYSNKQIVHVVLSIVQVVGLTFVI